MTKYSLKKLQQIVDLTATGQYTVAGICSAVGITKNAYYRWRERFPEFADAIERATEEAVVAYRDEALQAAKRSLLKLVEGYDATDTRIESVPSKDDPKKPAVKVQVSTKRHVGPNPAAVFFAFTNADPKHWKNRQTTEGTMTQRIDFRGFASTLPDVKEIEETTRKLVSENDPNRYDIQEANTLQPDDGKDETHIDP